jgi:hypothetical protein
MARKSTVLATVPLLEELVKVLLTDAIPGAIAERDAAQRTSATPPPHGVDGHLQLIRDLGNGQQLGWGIGHGHEHTSL